MAELSPLGMDTTTGLVKKAVPTDQLACDLKGISTNGIIGRVGNGEYAGSLGDVVVVQLSYTAFAVAGTDASVLIGTLPANSLPLEGSCYVEVAGDNVLTLNLDIRFGSVDMGIVCDGLVALPPGDEYSTVLNQNDGIIPRQAAAINVYARLVSTVGNLNTMTQGTFDFAYSFNTARVVV
jgi:hypothetical protein